MNFIRKQRRRIRSKSVLLASYRRNNRDWGNWLQREIAKPMLPLALLTALHMTEWIAIPERAFLSLIAAFVAWMGLVTWNAWGAFRKLDSRRLQFLEASGVDCSVGSLMSDPHAWAAVREGKTMREYLKSLRSE